MTERPSALAVDRRGFIRLASTTAAGWLALGATSDRVRVVASLTALPLDDELTRRSMIDSPTSRLGGLIVGLRQRGWVEGVNFRLELRSTFGAPDKLKTAVQELLALKPDVILTGSTVETAAVLAATKTIPIVFATANDPVGNGFVESLAHPGGNVTGFTNSTAEMGGKWLQLIREAVPDLARVGILFNPGDHTSRRPLLPRFRSSKRQRSSGVSVVPAPVSAPTEIDEAVRPYSEPPRAAMIALVDSFLVVHRQAVVAAAAKYRVPTIYPFRYFMDAGGLMTYGPTLEVRSADYVDLILRGTKAGDLPVQSPRKYELLINRTVADALGFDDTVRRCWRAPTRSASERGDRPGDDCGAPPGRLFRKYLYSIVALAFAALAINTALRRLVLLSRAEAAARGDPARAGSKRRHPDRPVHRPDRKPDQMALAPARRSCPTNEDQRLNAIRLLRLSPAIAEIAELDARGREQVRVSRRVADRIGSKADLSASPAFRGANESRVYYGPVYFFGDTEPFMTLATRGTGLDAGCDRRRGQSALHLGPRRRDQGRQHRQGLCGRPRWGRLIAHPDLWPALRTDRSLGASGRPRRARWRRAALGRPGQGGSLRPARAVDLCDGPLAGLAGVRRAAAHRSLRADLCLDRTLDASPGHPAGLSRSLVSLCSAGA